MCAALTGPTPGSKKIKLDTKTKVALSHTKDADELGSLLKRFRSDEGAGAGVGGEGSGSMSRDKRQARFNCVDPKCQLLDESPISEVAHHCGLCILF